MSSDNRTPEQKAADKAAKRARRDDADEAEKLGGFTSQSPGAGAPVHDPQLIDSPFVPGDVVRCNGPAQAGPGLCTGIIINVETQTGRPGAFSYEIAILPIVQAKVTMANGSPKDVMLLTKGTGYYWLHDKHRTPTETKLFCGPRDTPGKSLLVKIAGVDAMTAQPIVAQAFQDGISVPADLGIDHWGFGGPFRPPTGR
jgi:hypothetical protein